MSLGIGMFLRDTSLKYKQTGDELTKLAIQGIGKSTSTAMPMMYNTNYTNNQNPYQMQDSQGNAVDLKWLL
jgi:hypothetical protein